MLTNVVERDTAVTELETTRATIHQLQTDLTAAQAEADAARAAAAAAQAAQAQVAAAAPGHAPLIPRPAGLIRQLREHSGLDHVDYKACQVCLHPSDAVLPLLTCLCVHCSVPSATSSLWVAST